MTENVDRRDGELDLEALAGNSEAAEKVIQGAPARVREEIRNLFRELHVLPQGEKDVRDTVKRLILLLLDYDNRRVPALKEMRTTTGSPVTPHAGME